MSLLVAQSVALLKDLHSPGMFFSLEEGGGSTRILPFSPRPWWGPAWGPCLVPCLSPQRSGSCWNRLGTGRAGASGVTQKGIHKETSSETPWAKKCQQLELGSAVPWREVGWAGPPPLPGWGKGPPRPPCSHWSSLENWALAGGCNHAAEQGLVTQVFFKPHVGIQKSILPATGLVFLRLL